MLLTSSSTFFFYLLVFDIAVRGYQSPCAVSFVTRCWICSHLFLVVTAPRLSACLTIQDALRRRWHYIGVILGRRMVRQFGFGITERHLGVPVGGNGRWNI